MNIILFTKEELANALSLKDDRAVHVMNVLKFGIGDSFDMGVLNGSRGKATIMSLSNGLMTLDFKLEDSSPVLYPIELIIGAPRPQAARRILREATTMGVGKMMFCLTQKGVASYLKSKLWTSGEYKRHLEDGAAQAFCTQIPKVELFDSINSCVEALDGALVKIALDNYEATVSLGDCNYVSGQKTVLAIGSERGWSKDERDIFRQSNFTLAHLGPRVLKTETAITASLAIILSRTQYQL